MKIKNKWVRIIRNKKKTHLWELSETGITIIVDYKIKENMYWTLELAHHLEDAPWPATKDELIDYAIRSGAPIEVIENLNELEDEAEMYDSMEDIWPDYPRKDDFLFNEDEF